MKIAIDLRSLSSGQLTGVENYCLNLVDALLSLDKKNQYVLFYNSFGQNRSGDLNFVNSTVIHARWPNKLLNLALKTKLVSLERLIGEVDCLFMPNLNQFNLKQNIKIAITVHDLSPVITPEFYNIKRRVWHHFLNYKASFQRASILFAVSEYTKQDLVKIFGIDPGKIKVVYPGLDHKVYKPEISQSELRLARNIYGLPGEFILFLNTLEPRKNLANLIKAFELLDHPANLVIAGGLGWKYNSIFKLIRQSKKSAKIKYIGYVEEKHKPAIIKLAKTLAYPSFYEGFGFQPLEAMAIGTPVIASHLTSLPEVVGRGGLLVNPYSVSEISAALSSILVDQDLRRQLVNNAFIQSEKFNWQQAAEDILRNFNSI